ncbi:MAG: FAD-dependent oxidoreductase, partial [Rhodospirillaceae bacterium]|nr:FAD-dependent oxidoreductase [Rhodospirillaceae bacterium]
MAEHREKILIIGSGAAGLTAAIYAARAGLEPLLVAGMQPGGQLTITTEVENYPGFAEAVQGPWLMEQMQKQAENVGTRVQYDLITEADLSIRPFRLRGDSGDSYVADCVVVATGAQARWLGLESETRFNGRGVSACATCDGFFYRGKEVVVVGGGNTAVEEALYLANLCSKVTLVHRRDELRAERIMQERLFRNDKIEMVWDSVVDEVLGGEGAMDGVEAVRIRNVKSDATTDIAAEGCFVAIGHTPSTEVFQGQLELDDEGYLVAASPGTARSSVEGV